MVVGEQSNFKLLTVYLDSLGKRDSVMHIVMRNQYTFVDSMCAEIVHIQFE